MSYMTKSGVFLKFGTEFATPTTWGDYVSFGANRVIEGTITMAGTAGGATSIVSDVTWFPALAAGQLYIERVEVIAETAATGGTSYSVGIIQADRVTTPATSTFINGALIATVDTAGKFVNYFNGVTGAGALIGTGAALATGPYYITYSPVGTFTAGSIRVRILYHALGASITQ